MTWPLAAFLAGGAPAVEASVVRGLLVAVAMYSMVRLVRQRRAPWLESNEGLTMPLRLVLTVLSHLMAARAELERQVASRKRAKDQAMSHVSQTST